MALTYRCDSCGTTFPDEAQPAQCWKCGSVQVRRIEAAPGPGAGPSFSAPPVAPYLSSPGPAAGGPYGVGLFAALFWGGFGVTLIGTFIMAAAREPGLAVLPFLGIGSLIAAYVLNCIRLYRAWESIQSLRYEDPSESQMPTPGQAVGFLFIPFFNLYWMFVAWVGLAGRMNKFLDQRGVPGARMSVGLATTSCVLTCVSVIPYLGSLAALGNIVVTFLLYLSMTSALNAALTAAPGRGVGAAA